MALLVVALAPEECSSLTLAEWDQLVRCRRVWFERPTHPLVERLRDAGVAAGGFDDEPAAHLDGEALVTDPTSPRIEELVESGAELLCGLGSPPDALTAVRGAYASRRASVAFADLVAVMARLRAPDGCPWDAQQTHGSLQKHLVEETYEVIEAIEAGELGAELEEELGDVLLQVVFHAQLAAEEDRFDVATLIDVLTSKLVRRHPHVFADASVTGAAEVVRNWEQIKSGEKPKTDEGLMEGIPKGLPALLAAAKVLKRASRSGFEPAEGEVLERLSAASRQGDVGGLLFWAVVLARMTGVDPEAELRRGLRTFVEDGGAHARP